ncbi:MAG: glycosyl hydrolase 108 family protein [Microvirga sp.]
MSKPSVGAKAAMTTRADARFPAALAIVLAYEGGRAEHPRDPGGRTNQGVTQAVYDGFRRRRGLDPRSVHAMATPERDAIYRVQYWDKVRGDELPAGLDLVVFDGAVHSGPVQSVKWLQRALGGIAVDGAIGEVTLAAASQADPVALIGRVLDRRLAFLKALSTWAVFGTGWSRRIAHLRAAASARASGGSAPPPQGFPGGDAKARLADARAPAPVAAGAGAAGGGGAAALLAAAQGRIEPYVGTLPWLAFAVAALAVSGAVLLLAGAAYAWHARRRNDALRDALDLAGGGSGA